MRQPPYKIAHILPWSSVGGVEQATLRIAQATEGDGFRSTAFCLPDADVVADMFAAADFQVARYEAVEPSYRHPQAFLRASFRLAGELKRRRIDLVHCADLLAAHRTAFAAWLARVPVLCHIRCRFGEMSRRDQSFLWYVNRFVFVSHQTWRQFGYDVNANRGTVVYDGLEVDADEAHATAARDSARREFGIADDIKLVGMVARVAPAKDYETLIKAARQVVDRNAKVRFMVIGDCSSMPAYREHYEKVKIMLAEQGVAGHFIFTDFRSDVAHVIHALDVFTLSTHDEGLPLVILEAMAAAKPVVATAVGGIPEVVSSGETGLLYTHRDHAQLAAHLLSLLDDEKRAANLGQAGRRHVEANFSRQRFAANMIELYRQTLHIKSVTEGNQVVNKLRAV
jgi:glycosyltransferase involved in cell wall biosynthesis